MSPVRARLPRHAATSPGDMMGSGSVRSRWRARLRDDAGASAVELALVLTVLIYFLFGTIQFGIAYNRYQGLQAAAREGARIASIGGNELEVRTRSRQAQSLFQADHVKVRIDYSTNDGATWPGSNTLCDDQSGSNRCDQTSPSPCAVAGLGTLIRVTATVPASLKAYPITIPLWGNEHITYESHGAFRCEAIGA